MNRFMLFHATALVFIALIGSNASANSLEVQVAYNCGEDLPKVLEIRGELHLYLDGNTELEVFRDTAIPNRKQSTGYFLEIESESMAYLWKAGDSDIFDCAKPNP